MLLETQHLFLILTQKKIQSPNHGPEVSTWSILPSSSFALSFLTLVSTQRPRRTLVLSVLLARDALLLEILQAAFLASFRLRANGTCDVLPGLPISFSCFLPLAFIPNILHVFFFLFIVSPQNTNCTGKTLYNKLLYSLLDFQCLEHVIGPQ